MYGLPPEDNDVAEFASEFQPILEVFLSPPFFYLPGR